MPATPMPSLPVPVFAALVLGWFLIRALVRREGAPVFLALIALCAAQAMITALALHYGQPWAQGLRPVTAAAIPALAWVAFVTTAVRDTHRGDVLHLIGPAFVGFCRAFVPWALDLAIPLLFLGYGMAILLALRAGPDGLPRLTLGAGDKPGQLWRAVGWALIGSAFSDLAIIAAALTGQGGLVPWIVSLASTLTLALVGGVALTPDVQPEAPAPDATPPASDPEQSAAEADLLARLADLMQRERLYLDPDLSLNRLARRLHVPAKRLSEAVNRQSAGNVARYINGFRVAAACAALRQGQNVTEAMLAAGFSTKSNFNRAFLLATGQAPSQWRETAPLRLAQNSPTFDP